MRYGFKAADNYSQILNESSDRPSDDAPKQLKYRYQIVTQLGQGGFGKTFLAIDTSQPLQPYCVVKQLLLHNCDDAHREMAIGQFHQEVRQLTALGNHPQIPQLLDAFEWEQQFYLVQEWIDGQTLEQELAEKGTFDEKDIHQLLSALLPVLQYIHEHHVIHRDVKPANIIRRYGDKQFVLVDFGASKHITHFSQRRTDTLIGSAEYVAPEQTRGKAIFASDLYSLGVTCIHLLTQLSPFDLVDTSENAWIWRNYVDHSLSEALGQILDRLLYSATSQRYASAASVLAALSEVPSVFEPDVLLDSSTADVEIYLASPGVHALQNQYPSGVIKPETTNLRLPLKYNATIFEPATQRWHHMPAVRESLETTSRSQHPGLRLAAAAKVPSYKTLPHATATDGVDQFEFGWRVLTALMVSATSIIALMTLVFAIEAYLPATLLHPFDRMFNVVKFSIGSIINHSKTLTKTP